MSGDNFISTVFNVRNRPGFEQARIDLRNVKFALSQGNHRAVTQLQKKISEASENSETHAEIEIPGELSDPCWTHKVVSQMDNQRRLQAYKRLPGLFPQSFEGLLS